MKEETIAVKGMHCRSCADRIQTRLSRLKGVGRVKVSLPDERAVVSYDPRQLSVADMEEEIRGLGYGAGVDGSRPVGGGRGGMLQGIAYGLVPHIGCIGFIVATVLGVTVATEFFKPLLMSPYFFYILVGMSFVFATISSLLYLKRQGFISIDRATDGYELNVAANTLQRKWKYLGAMYGSTIAINLLLFFVVFPAVANLSFAQPTSVPLTGNLGAIGAVDGLASMKLQVQIPCSGHAPLITGELRKLPGVKSATFAGSNTFDVIYDPTVTPKEDVLGLEVFGTYKATVLGEAAAVTAGAQAAQTLQAGAVSSVIAAGGCGCAGPI